VTPNFVGEVAFSEWTNDGRLRHPSFQGLRFDKPAPEVVREAPARLGRPRGQSRGRAGGRE
jgi:bifunctional non-homologous end joining protein LigD